MLKINHPTTLFSRLVSIISGLTFSIVVLFTAATLLITYSFEDVLFNERLKQAHAKLKNGEALPYNIRLIDDFNELEPDLKQQLRYFELGQNYKSGEFSAGERHYHYLVTDNGTILYDTTDVALVDRALEDVFLILAVLLIPTIFLTLWVAKLSARYALKPFTQLSQLFVDEQHTQIKATPVKKSIDDIKEQDVKHIALELQSALRQKTEVLEQQMVFNQGMAHELRTPLQVMSNSVELLSENQPQAAQSPAFMRLEKSINRMRSLSNGLLWLTSEQAFNGETDVGQTIQNVMQQLKEQCLAHAVKIDLKISSKLIFPLPEDVLELIVSNLFNNVVNHGYLEKTGIRWSILVGEQQVEFSNLVAENTNSHDQILHFGIGLTLVSRLAERFNLITAYKTEHNQYSFTLSLA